MTKIYLTDGDFELIFHMLASGRTEAHGSKKIRIFRNYFAEETKYIRDYVKNAFDKKLITKGQSDERQTYFFVTKLGLDSFKIEAKVRGYKVIEDPAANYSDPNKIEAAA